MKLELQSKTEEVEKEMHELNKLIKDGECVAIYSQRTTAPPAYPLKALWKRWLPRPNNCLRSIRTIESLYASEEFAKLEALDEATKSYEQLKAYEQRITFAYGKAETLRSMAGLLAPEAPAVISKQTEETLRLIKPKVEMWHQICSWQTDTEKVKPYKAVPCSIS